MTHASSPTWGVQPPRPQSSVAPRPPAARQVTERAKTGEAYAELVKYLLMVRKKQKEPRVDTELVYAYAKVGQSGRTHPPTHPPTHSPASCGALVED